MEHKVGYKKEYKNYKNFEKFLLEENKKIK